VYSSPRSTGIVFCASAAICALRRRLRRRRKNNRRVTSTTAAITPITNPAMTPPLMEDEDEEVLVGSVVAGRVLVAIPTGQDPVGSIVWETQLESEELATW
jgi:hypothetical protein